MNQRLIAKPLKLILDPAEKSTNPIHLNSILMKQLYKNTFTSEPVNILKPLSQDKLLFMSPEKAASQITFGEFKDLSLEHQKKEIEKSGILLGNRNALLLRIKLYQLYNFYVEAYFTSYSDDFICFIASDSGTSLRSYSDASYLSE